MFRPPKFYRSKNDFFIPNTNPPPFDPSHDERPQSRVTEVLSEFCAKSSIHGIAYLDRKRHWIERVWWIIAIVLSVLLCMHSIHNVWLKWKDNPVILTFNAKPVSIRRIPFPAMSICPTTKVLKSQLDFTAVYRALLSLDGNNSRTITPEELEMMKVASQICDERISKDVLNLFPEKYINDSIIDMINTLSPRFNETVVACKFSDQWIKCDKLLFPIITEDGLCFTFNALNMHDILTTEVAPELMSTASTQPRTLWQMEKGYDEYTKGEPYPYRVCGTGMQASLIVVLKVSNDDIDNLCGGALQGFKVVFHSPHEGPRIHKKHFQVSPGRTMLLSIDPKLIVSSSSVRKYSPELRQCYFNSERQLRFYKNYTQRNCKIECLSNFTLTQCGCVHFSMPRIKGTKVCGPAKIDCLDKATNHMHRFGNSDACNCLQTCTSFTYNAHSSQADYDPVSTYTKSKSQPNFHIGNSSFSRLVVSFKEELFTPTRRAEFFTMTDFIASFGGLFSLFMGASLLSIIELLYYFTLRIYFMYRNGHQITHIERVWVVPFQSQNLDITRRDTQNDQKRVYTFLP